MISQTYSDLEYLIIDGGSTDGTLEIVEEYRSRITGVWAEKDRGISHAFNKGLYHATGDAILMLNAGDCFLSSSVVADYVADYTETPVDILFYKVQVDASRGLTIPSERYGDDGERIWQLAEVPHQGAFVTREAYTLLGGYDPMLKIRMDYAFFIRAAQLQVSHRYVPRVIVDYEQGGTSMRPENGWYFTQEYLRVNRFLGIPNPPRLEWTDRLRTVKRKLLHQPL